MQKAIADNVAFNKCKMDSILWFHLECPKWAAKFDDPNHFKRKFRQFFEVQQFTEKASKYTPPSAEINGLPKGKVAYPDQLKKAEFSLPEGDHQLAPDDLKQGIMYPDEVKAKYFTKLADFKPRDGLGDPQTPHFWEKLEEQDNEKRAEYQEKAREKLNEMLIKPSQQAIYPDEEFKQEAREEEQEENDQDDE